MASWGMTMTTKPSTEAPPPLPPGAFDMALNYSYPALVWAMTKMSPADRDIARDSVRTYEAQFLEANHSAPLMQVAYSQQVLIDELVAEHKAAQPERAAEIKCRKGCSHCCRQSVHITQGEAQLLARTVMDERI